MQHGEIYKVSQRNSGILGPRASVRQMNFINSKLDYEAEWRLDQKHENIREETMDTSGGPTKGGNLSKR